MSLRNHNIEERKAKAICAIEQALGTDADEYGATLFISHHLKALDQRYWIQYLNNPSPEALKVVSILELVPPPEESELDVLDFTLPGDVSNYVLSVSFDESGNVDEIAIES